MEDVVSRIEESLVEDYGLVKRCRLPHFDHGVASCNYHDLKPGSVCKSICDAGWIASPGMFRSSMTSSFHVSIEVVAWPSARTEASGTPTSSVSSPSWWWLVGQQGTLSIQLRLDN